MATDTQVEQMKLVGDITNASIYFDEQDLSGFGECSLKTEVKDLIEKFINA